ncbi:hypothetical protein FE257_002907 [Aspergillus nanangensis]|uniref:Potassium transport protein n=1 Tax=Aspergillus nanangensis TaxID=2582783 RepID=A0AAD4GVQ1_ASPNN|nr:hypothetical protein FE257_002907 [Aspergillus nanangensis]
MEKTTETITQSDTLDSSKNKAQPQTSLEAGETVDQVKRPWWYSVKEPGSALQIVIAAILAIAIGLAVTATVDNVPEAAPTIIEIPGILWLRALKAVVLPMIMTAMILAVQRLREMTGSGHIIARWTIGYYILTTLLAIVHSILLSSLVWRRLMVKASDASLAVEEDDKEEFEDREDVDIPEVVVQMFESLIPDNVVNSLATDSLLAVLVTAVVIGYVIDSRTSYILKAVQEVEQIIMTIIRRLIQLAPIGVFFLILPNMFKLDMKEVGQNLGVLMGGTICSLAIHLFIVLPLIFFVILRQFPYTYWAKCSSAWTTAWGTASSAATLPLTLKCARERGVPNTVTNFAVPLGCLVNMDGTAIYFPMCIVFLATTQGIVLAPTDYVIICLLSTLASIGTTPIPSSSLVLTVMIAGSVNVPLTGMYAVIVAIDWFLDTYIISLSLLGIVVLLPYGNLSAVDAFFFGVSSATESGLNVVDVNKLKTYQQLFLYFVPTVSNIIFMNIIVVIVRLFWFEKRLRAIGLATPRPEPKSLDSSEYRDDPERQPRVSSGSHTLDPVTPQPLQSKDVEDDGKPTISIIEPTRPENDDPGPTEDRILKRIKLNGRSISFAETEKPLYIPPPRARDRGDPIVEVDVDVIRDDTARSEKSRPSLQRNSSMRNDLALDRVASNMFILGAHPSRSIGPQIRETVSLSKDSNLPGLSSQATLGRNSQFHNLTAEDREKLGGIEYRSLKLLLKVVIAFFFGLHTFGVICLIGWIQYAPAKYRDYLDKCGQNHIWWAFYSAQTMSNNLGFTITPDSMVSFQDATFPLLIMTFLAFAGNTLYPCLLRLVIWIMFKCVPETSSLKEPLDFLLKYPRRCYMLLFRSRPTWILFGIIFLLNFVDVILIVALDLDNPAVNNLPLGPRILAALFQAASSRHTGTATFNLADVNPAVQFSLLVMMYISIFPIAISVRASNTYEESALGIYSSDDTVDESHGAKYVLTHMRNQLSFDLWYMFLGIFCICIAESKRIMDTSTLGISVFAIFFEIVSAYGNVGLSLGYPTISTALSGELSTFSKVIICAMMIRGRHRGLPYQLDRAILLPGEHLVDDRDDTRSHMEQSVSSITWLESRQPKVKRYYTR